MNVLASTLIASALLLGSQVATAQPDHGHHDPHRDHAHGYAGHDRHGDRHHDPHHGDRGHYYGHPQAYVAPRRHYDAPYRHHWMRGHRYYGPTYVVRDYRSYRLRPPPRGYHWVRDDSSFLLVAAATGIILDIAMR